MSKKLLMIPGPIEVDPDVLLEMSRPMVAHYGKEWADFFNETTEMIKGVIGTDAMTFLHVGSGHAAIDAVVGSLVEEGDKVLVLINGFFGERIAEIVESYRGEAVRFRKEWGDYIKPEELDEYLRKNHEEFKAVMMVHNETSTGVSNPVRELSRVINKYDLLTFVDGVCSIGVEEYKMDKWNIDFSITASQKGLGIPPGLAIISVSDRAWEVIEDREKEPVGWYLNLKTMREFVEKQKTYQPYGITMAVGEVRALNKQLKLIEEEGLEARIKRHHSIAKYIRENVKEMGLDIVAPENYACNNITVIKTPEGVSSDKIVRVLDEEYNISVANGLGIFSGEAIRVGHMNLGASKNGVVPVINALEEIIEKYNLK